MTSPLTPPHLANATDGNTNTVGTKRLVRGQDRMLGGVASGLADYFQVDVSLVRLLFVLVALLPGPAFVGYILAWIVVPEAGTIGDTVGAGPAPAATAESSSVVNS